MTSRRLKGIAEQAEQLQQEITALEKLVRIKDDISQINDSTFAQHKLFPSSLELWRKIVAAQIQLYKLREKEKQLKKKIEKDRNQSIDFSILNKYRRYKRPPTENDKKKVDVVEERRPIMKETIKEEPPGFIIRFKLSDAYEAIHRQEQVLTRPRLTQFFEKQTPNGTVHFYFDQASKKWKRFNEDGKPPSERLMSDQYRIIEGRGLPDFIRQTLNSMPKRRQSERQLDPESVDEDRTLRGLSRTSGDTLLQSREQIQNGLKNEDNDTLSDLTANDLLSNDDQNNNNTGSPNPVAATIASKLIKSGSTDLQPGSKMEKRRVERLKFVASQMNALQNHMKSMADDDKLEELEEDIMKTCKYLYRLPYCKCIANHSKLINEDIVKQIAGTIDVLEHTEDGHAVGNVECDYCMKLPRVFIHNWLSTLRTGSTRGVYGEQKYNWFPSRSNTIKK